MPRCSIKGCQNKVAGCSKNRQYNLCTAHHKSHIKTDQYDELVEEELVLKEYIDYEYREVQFSDCNVDINVIPHLPHKLKHATSDYESDGYFYDHEKKKLSFKLFETNPYKEQLKQIYSLSINEDQLTDEMLSIIKQYTGNHYLKTNLNLLSDFDIDWDYTNKLRSIIRGLYQLDLRKVYYRGLNLSDIEVNYFKQKIGTCYYTNSFSSFTTEKNLAFKGNALMILNTTRGNRLNIANVWKWSRYPNEMEAILSIAARLKILNVDRKDGRWIIEVQLVGND